VKFVHAIPNVFSGTTTTTQAGLQVFLNNQKITGTPVGIGGGVVPGLEYSLVPAGNLTLKAVLPTAVTTTDSVVLTAPLELTSGKTYTVFLTDTLPTASILKVEENFSVKADSGKYFVRLVNLTPKSTAYDLYGVTDAQTVIPNVAYKTASAFTQIFAGTGARSFAIRKTGSATNVATVSITPVAGRMYTIVSYGVDGGTGARLPKLAFFTSRFQQ
jgi:hypothetical protein